MPEGILKKMITENILNLAEDINLQIYEAEWTPNRLTQRNSHLEIIINLLKNKNKNIKNSNDKWHIT